MNYPDIKKEINLSIEKISKQIEIVNLYHPDKDMSLDIDLVKDDLRMLYRQLELLKQLSHDQQFKEMVAASIPEEDPQIETREEPSTEEPEVKPEPETEPEAEPEAEAEAEPEAEPEPEPEPEAKPQPEPQHFPEPSPAPQPQSQSQSQSQPQPQPQPQPQSQPKAVNDLLASYRQKTIGEQYLASDNSLHQRISGDKEDKSIGARMQQQPVHNIKNVIGVNEKFLFINELFNGDIEIYHQSIGVLNEKENMEAAFEYLNELAKRFSWDARKSAATIEKLAAFVQRRYMH